MKIETMIKIIWFSIAVAALCAMWRCACAL
jgi:hypothetical protein